MQAIEVSHLIKKFGSLTALNNINFSVGEGETFGFLGPNVDKQDGNLVVEIVVPLKLLRRMQ